MKQISLPEIFRQEMKSLLGKDYDSYIESFEAERVYGLRVNTAKLEPEEFEAVSPFPLTRVPWVSNGYYYPGEERPSKDVYYYAGLYYLQEPSAMTPAAMLPVEPGDRVLDLCAAPGGKSTELGARLKGRGLLVANDISNTRAKALLKNLELFGIPNICVTSETPERLGEAFPVFFDKILVDAPCSGEGMFRKDPDMIKSWEEKGPEYYAGIQRTIVDEAADMLRPGGMMLYSTCTFSKLEDEEMIRGLLERKPELELVPLPLFEGASDGIGLSGCMRLFPHKLNGEGHFLALLRKREDGENAGVGQTPTSKAAQTTGKKAGLRTGEPMPEEIAEFFAPYPFPFAWEQAMIRNQMVYILPREWKQLTSLRCLRTGLLLGELKKGRFEPSQALAMALKAEQFPTVFSMSRDDERVIRYLKGETLSLTEEEAPVKGWCLVCVDHHPLGFAKGGGMSLKNKYYPGWRWM